MIIRVTLTIMESLECSNEMLHHDDCNLAHTNYFIVEFTMFMVVVEHLSLFSQNVQNLYVGQLELFQMFEMWNTQNVHKTLLMLSTRGHLPCFFSVSLNKIYITGVIIATFKLFYICHLGRVFSLQCVLCFMPKVSDWTTSEKTITWEGYSA